MIETLHDLKRYMTLSPHEEAAIEQVGARYPWRITEYYASLMDPSDPACPIRRQAIPDQAELDGLFDDDDPLCEVENTPAPGVIRVYPDRVALVVTGRCPAYCRFCLRKRLPRGEDSDLTGERLEKAVAYIRGDSTIRDVLVTGGDPLMFADGYLDDLLGRLRHIPHVEILRIGTRVPVTWPERVTPDLAVLLARYHPLWLNTQFNHPREVTEQAAGAIERLLAVGIPVGNQSVLLHGVNDDPAVMLDLVRRLVSIRVRPYYLYQAQTLAGTAHFVTRIERGIEMIRALRGWTTGFSVPQYVLDTPYGKIPLNPEWMVGRTGDLVELTSYDGRHWREYNPQSLP